MIPLDARLDPRAKVRIGEKRQSRSGNSYPAALDHFVSDDPELEDLHGRTPKRVPIVLCGDTVEDVFPTTLEWWGKKEANRATLVCYSKDAKTARRLEAKVDPGDEAVGQPHNGRQAIVCKFRRCPRFNNRGCRPMGRLDFFLHGGRQDLPLRFETKSFHSIEAILPFLKNLARLGPLSTHVLDLCVRIEKDGDKQYPVVWLEPRDVKDSAAAAADAPADAGTVERAAAENSDRDQLIALLELDGHDPRDPNIAAWVKRNGIAACLDTMRRRQGV